MKKLIASLAAAVWFQGTAAENTGTSIPSNQSAVAAVLATAKLKEVASAPKAKPSLLFAPQVAFWRTASTNKDTKGTGVVTQTRATNAVPSATGLLPRARRESAYELVPMTTEALAERRAIFGLEIRRKRKK